MEDKDEILYHYTSQKGLLGILNDGGIWATHIAYLNDSTEYNYAVDLLRKEIVDRLKSLPARFITPPFAVNGKLSKDEIIQDFLQIFFNFIEYSDNLNISVFVCSFSEEGNLLSQWRAYCPNANGFSIGFKKSNLIQIAKKNNFELARCEYNENKQKVMIKELINKFIGKLDIDMEKADILLIISSLLEEFALLAARLKDKAFKEEKEWRLISNYSLGLMGSIREGKSMLIPYSHVNFVEKEGYIQIEEIFIGPTPHKELAYKSIATLLHSKGNIFAKIYDSKIPYRAW